MEEIDLENSQLETADYNRDTQTAVLAIWEEGKSGNTVLACRPVCYQIRPFGKS